MDNRIMTFANQLYEAEKSRVSIGPLTEADPGLSMDDAYAIQLANVARVVKEGYVVSGKKIGLTSEGIQKQLGVNEPDYGHLFASMNCPDGKIITADLMQPKIEGEIAFILKEDLPGGKVTEEDVRRATDYVSAAFEIVDSRVRDWNIRLADTVSDNASSGRYVLGGRKRKLEEVDLSHVTMKLYKNDGLEAEGTGAAVLGDPCRAVSWLANRLWGYGVTLQKGEVILSGAFTAAPLAEKGDRFRAEFSGFGTVEAEFI